MIASGVVVVTFGNEDKEHAPSVRGFELGAMLSRPVIVGRDGGSQGRAAKAWRAAHNLKWLCTVVIPGNPLVFWETSRH
jgi:hypothetical protein